jgi:RimJ/RimL family protein N-acetyltransferase
MENTYSTERLVLAQLSKNDATFIHDLVNSEGWIKFIGDRKVRSISDAEIYIEEILSNPEIKYFVVSMKENQAKVGIITIIKRDYLEHADIGFAFLPRHAKNSFAYEASKTILDAMLLRSDRVTVLATTVRDNKRSVNLLEKLGFTFSSTITVDDKCLSVYRIESPC